MKLKCPACGAPVTAADINVQQLIAVCPHCDNVFKIDGLVSPEQRKIKAPPQVNVAGDNPAQLDMSFKWSWRTEPPMSMVAIMVMLMISLIILPLMIGEGAPLLVTLLPLALAGWGGYTLLTLLLNRTHYQSDGETLKVFTEPLPYFRYGSKAISLDEIRDVTVERPTYPAFPEGRDGFYDVYVHTFDDKIRIAAIVNYQHANFIAQELKAHLQAARQPAVRLTADYAEAESDEAEVQSDEGKKPAVSQHS